MGDSREHEKRVQGVEKKPEQGQAKNTKWLASSIQDSPALRLTTTAQVLANRSAHTAVAVFCPYQPDTCMQSRKIQKQPTLLS